MRKKNNEAKGVSRTGVIVSLREAVRPAIFVHALATRQRSNAAELHEEARNLLEHTNVLLLKLGMVHLLTGGVDVSVSGRIEPTSTPDRLVAAYASAGEAWANVVGSLAGLAEILIADADWKGVRQVASLLEEAGEAGLAREIRAEVVDSQAAAYRSRLVGVHVSGTMTAIEIRKVLDILRTPDVPAACRESEVKARWRVILVAARELANENGNKAGRTMAIGMLYGIADHLASPSAHPLAYTTTDFFALCDAIVTSSAQSGTS